VASRNEKPLPATAASILRRELIPPVNNAALPAAVAPKKVRRVIDGPPVFLRSFDFMRIPPDFNTWQAAEPTCLKNSPTTSRNRQTGEKLEEVAGTFSGTDLLASNRLQSGRAHL
jgi:hypothetical protein